MNRKDLTIADIQHHCGVSRSTVYRWLNGDVYPTGEAFVRLRELLRLDRSFNIQAGPWNDPIVDTDLKGRTIVVFKPDGHIVYSEPYISPLYKRCVIHENIFTVLMGHCMDQIKTACGLAKGGYPICMEFCRSHEHRVRFSMAWVHYLPHKDLYKYHETWFDQVTLPKNP